MHKINIALFSIIVILLVLIGYFAIVIWKGEPKLGEEQKLSVHYETLSVKPTSVIIRPYGCVVSAEIKNIGNIGIKDKIMWYEFRDEARFDLGKSEDPCFKDMIYPGDNYSTLYHTQYPLDTDNTSALGNNLTMTAWLWNDKATWTISNTSYTTDQWTIMKKYGLVTGDNNNTEFNDYLINAIINEVPPSNLSNWSPCL